MTTTTRRIGKIETVPHACITGSHTFPSARAPPLFSNCNGRNDLRGNTCVCSRRQERPSHCLLHVARLHRARGVCFGVVFIGRDVARLPHVGGLRHWRQHPRDERIPRRVPSNQQPRGKVVPSDRDSFGSFHHAGVSAWICSKQSSRIWVSRRGCGEGGMSWEVYCGRSGM